MDLSNDNVIDIRNYSRSPSAEELPFVDVIWNSTLVCPHDCAICCVDAVHVARRGDWVILRSAGLEEVTRLRRDPSAGSIYAQAAADRQRRGLELDLAGKLRVLDHLEGSRPRLDISGGDALVVPDTILVLEEAVRRFGREQITLTVTGSGSHDYSAERLAPLVGEFNFTFDGVPKDKDGNRPPMYAIGNLRKAKEMSAAGVRTRGEVPLTKQNIDPDELRHIYLSLHEGNIDKLLVMRLFPVGRGVTLPDQIPSRDEYLSAIAFLRDLEARYGHPKVTLQCALRHLDARARTQGPNPCDALRESFGLAADGTLLISPWAINRVGKPMHPTWVLGNLAEQPLTEILASERVARMREKLDSNYGHCKIFAWGNGASSDPEQRIFEQTDPLYVAGAASDSGPIASLGGPWSR